MMRGDISNRRALVIGFRCENSLLRPKEGGPLNAALNALRGSLARADVDEGVLSLMRHIYWDTEHTPVLVVDSANYTGALRRRLDGFPFSGVVNVLRNVSEVTMMLNTGEMSYLVDEDPEDRARVCSKYAVSLEEFNAIFKRTRPKRPV